MAMEQALALTRLILTCNPKTPSLSIPSSLFLPFQSPMEPMKNKRLSVKGRVKCTVGYESYDTNVCGAYEDRLLGPQYPRPSEIQWKKEFSNFVQLIGTVAAPIQIKNLSSGKVLAWSRLAFKKSASETSWINLTFWDELAHTAVQHVEKGNQIYVSGRLVSDTVDNDDGKQQTFFKLVVQQLNFIERNQSSVALYDGDSNYATSGRKPNSQNGSNTGSIEALWQAFFANPVDWWDNRKNKRNPKYPDFKHKDTGEALWIDGRYNPPWVKSQLAILDSRMEAFHDQNASMQVHGLALDDYVSS